MKNDPIENIPQTEEEWRGVLSAEQFHVLRQKGTERAFTGEFWDNHQEGLYRCAGCGAELFQSDEKYDSGCGWPSFYQSFNPEAIEEHIDNSHGMKRIEVTCKKCGGHLGHIFPDGPKPTGVRYCINSASLKFEGK